MQTIRACVGRLGRGFDLSAEDIPPLSVKQWGLDAGKKQAQDVVCFGAELPSAYDNLMSHRAVSAPINRYMVVRRRQARRRNLPAAAIPLGCPYPVELLTTICAPSPPSLPGHLAVRAQAHADGILHCWLRAAALFGEGAGIRRRRQARQRDALGGDGLLR